MDYKTYRITEKALSDIRGVVEYLSVNLCNKKAAKDLMEELEKTISFIMDFPESYAIVLKRFHRRSCNAKGECKNLCAILLF